MLDKPANHPIYFMCLYMSIYFMMFACVELQIYKFFRCQTIFLVVKPCGRLSVYVFSMLK